jgi:hypothetical protein
LKKLTAALIALLVCAPAALAATSSHFVKVSPSSTSVGQNVKLSGSVAGAGHGCKTGHKGNTATLYSKAFAGITKSKYNGIPSISVSLAKSKNGSFSKNVTLQKQGTYTITGRCGTANFGTAKVKVAPSGFY